MNYLALYRKYRPDTFDGVIGQDHIVGTLKNQIKNGKVSHAYLFCGTRGTGKTSTAKIFARAINCTDTKDGNPCGHCDVCKKLTSANLDIIEMDAASNNGVDYARDIREKVQFPPQIGRYKVYIIDEVHMLSQGAFNALLKTLEEPPEHAVFILCTTEVHKLPATILSRCMRFDFRLVPTEMLAAHIEEIYDKEGKQYRKEAVYAIASAAEGSVRDSLSIADRCFSMEGELTYDSVMSVLGISSRSVVTELADAVLQNETENILQKTEELVAQGKDIGRLSKDLAQNFRDILISKTCKNANRLLCLPEDIYADVTRSAEKTTVPKLLYAMDCLSRLEGDLRYALSPRYLFEATVLRIAAGTGEVDVDGLERRIARLEQQNRNLTADTVTVIDRTNYQSVWNGVKVAILRHDKPILAQMWTEVDAKIEDGNFVVTCNKGEYQYIMTQEYDFLAKLIKDLVKLNLVLKPREEQEDPMAKLRQLGDIKTNK